MNRKWILWVLGLAFTVAVAGLGWNIVKDQFSYIRGFDTMGKLIIHQEEQVPHEDITDFTLAEEKLFLYYEDSGMLNVYSLDGKFLKGFQVCTRQNSRGYLSFGEGLVLVEAKCPVIYAFDPLSLELKFCVTGGHEKYEAQDDEYLEFKRLQGYFSTEKSHSSGESHFILSDDRRDVLVSRGVEPYRSMSFLPKKNDRILSFAITSAFLFIGICACIESIPSKKSTQ